MSTADPASLPRTSQVTHYPADVVGRYRDSGAWGYRTLGERFRDAARAHAERLALVAGPMRLTYAELDRLSEAFGAGLLRRGHAPGERVLFQVGNVGEAVVAYYGVLKAGLVPVCSLAQHRDRDMSALAAVTGASVHIVQADFRSYALVDLARSLAERHSALRTLIAINAPSGTGTVGYESLIDEGEPSSRQVLAGVRPDLDGLAVMQLSGGTTATPKLIPRLHAEYVYNAEIWARFLGWDTGSIVMHALPLMHNACIAAAMQPAHFSGATFVLAPNAEAATILATIEAMRVTDVPVVPPAVLLRLLESPERVRRDLSSIRHFVIAGQKLPIETAERLESELGIRCLQMFGMAEGMFLATPADAPGHVRKTTVGVPVSPLDEVRIVRPNTEDPVPFGEVGEFCARGPYTIRGYYDAGQHNAVAFTSDGFYRTGDLAQAHLTADGSTVYSIEGRIKDVINRGCEKINAEEVEELLVDHPAIRQAAIVAMPDRELGERACAFVVLRLGRSTFTVAECAAFLLGRGIAKFKLPERVEVIDRLPLTDIGKVSKRDLREIIAAMLARETTPSPQEFGSMSGPTADLEPYGVDHLAFVTWDPKATLTFYRDIMGFPLVHAITARGWGIDSHPDFVHFFFALGKGNHVAFFYYFGEPPEEEIPTPLMKRARHLAFHVETEAELLAYRERLMAAGVRVTRPVAHEVIESIYFDDPNGIQLEITRPLRRFDQRDAQDARLTLDALIANLESGTPSSAGMWREKGHLVARRLPAAVR
jgi:2,3-dihydroxybenzoate-AMP ligase